MSLSEVAKNGNRIETLTALRDYLAKALDECESDRDKASLSLRLMDCINQLEGIQPVDTETAAERIKRRAEERRAAAEGSQSG
jgi:hypothetical protein